MVYYFTRKLLSHLSWLMAEERARERMKMTRAMVVMMKNCLSLLWSQHWYRPSSLTAHTALRPAGQTQQYIDYPTGQDAQPVGHIYTLRTWHRHHDDRVQTH